MLMNMHEAAATLLVGVDAARNERNNISSRPRVMTGLAVVGSAAVDDCAVDVYIEDYYVGRFRNTHAGVIQVEMPADLQPVGSKFIPAGSRISVIIQTAPITSPLNVVIYGN